MAKKAATTNKKAATPQKPAAAAKPVRQQRRGSVVSIMGLLALLSMTAAMVSVLCATNHPVLAKLGDHSKLTCDTTSNTAAQAREFLGKSWDSATEAAGKDTVAKVLKQAEELRGKAADAFNNAYVKAYDALSLPVDNPKTEAPRKLIDLVLLFVLLMVLSTFLPVYFFLFIGMTYVALYPGRGITAIEALQKHITIVRPFVHQLIDMTREAVKQYF